MTYPPEWRQVAPDAHFVAQLVQKHPFARLFTAEQTLAATSLPFIADFEAGRMLRLRAHLNASNPQLVGLNGARAIVVFSGPATYVSPHWRTDLGRAGTIDYEEVQVVGRITTHAGDREFFCTLIDDLARLLEPQYAASAPYPVWNTSMAPAGYIDRLLPAIVGFSMQVEQVRAIAKLHQHFPAADRRSIAAHLERCAQADALSIAARLRAGLE
jgi:transcriptional regulator